MRVEANWRVWGVWGGDECPASFCSSCFSWQYIVLTQNHEYIIKVGEILALQWRQSVQRKNQIKWPLTLLLSMPFNGSRCCQSRIWQSINQSTITAGDIASFSQEPGDVLLCRFPETHGSRVIRAFVIYVGGACWSEVKFLRQCSHFFFFFPPSRYFLIWALVLCIGPVSSSAAL